MSRDFWQEKIEAQLEKLLGLNPDALGPSAMSQAIERQMDSLGIADMGEYHRTINTSPSSLESLIQEIVVNETWFFRHPAAFRLLKESLPEISHQSNGRDRQIHSLSVGCATGEEPYSIAMALYDAGLSVERFRVDALDISESALAVARRGVYGAKSFHDTLPPSIDRQMQHVNGSRHLSDAIKGCVRFHRGNALNLPLSWTEPTYHFIFCRNVFIYMDAKSQEELLDQLAALLHPCGYLFVGCAESNRLVTQRFDNAKYPGAFAFTAHLRNSTFDFGAPLSPKSDEKMNWETAIAEPHTHDELLELASAAADEGDLKQAEEMCYRAILRDQTNPAAHCLFGLIKQAKAQDLEAVTAYRKVLYLEPNNLEALVHLSLLMEIQGNHEEVQSLKERIRTIRAKPEKGVTLD